MHVLFNDLTLACMMIRMRDAESNPSYHLVWGGKSESKKKGRVFRSEGSTVVLLLISQQGRTLTQLRDNTYD